MFRRLSIQFKIVYDCRIGQYNVMYKTRWYSKWKYYRRPAGQCGPKFRYVWTWNSRKSAEVFINQQYISMGQDPISQEEFDNLESGDRVMLRYGYAGTIDADLKKYTFSDTQMIKVKQDIRKFICPYFKRSEIVEVIKKKKPCK